MNKLEDKPIIDHTTLKQVRSICFIGNMSSFEAKVLIEQLKIDLETVTIYFTSNKKSDNSVLDFTEKLGVEVAFLQDYYPEMVTPILSKAKMGTKLYLIGEWKMVLDIKQQALEFGFTEEEIIAKGIGEKEEHVFCVKCYHINKKTEKTVIRCEKCQQKLDVSAHYSKRHDAYLGFISL
ncbi:dimethylamine monooxygenase subunit DmmA family protein [Bacillus sp. T3]|uniref:dimethylamine monooxygenase subunit DmmA family protein n=1 Tax=Bacillus sp. T3 TaxID=467262 RepID=UPI0029825C74|nr:dimethylamine monooxygenase subunit DmmA family protein [Bacillus sp. T3]